MKKCILNSIPRIGPFLTTGSTSFPLLAPEIMVHFLGTFLCVHFFGLAMIKKTINSLFLSKRKELPFIILAAFLVTFSVSRLVVRLIYAGILPNMFLFVADSTTGEPIHVHHMNYGIILLSIIGFIAIAYPKVISRFPHIAGISYGTALGLIFDEFALFFLLEDDYYHRLSYDAVIVISLILSLTIYFPPFFRWSRQKIKGIYEARKLPLDQ